MSFLVPTHMISATALLEPVEVVRAPEIASARGSDSPKTSTNFPGTAAYRVTVEYLRGTREKTFQDGEIVTIPVLDQVTVTVWSATSLKAEVGDYVVFNDLMIGAVDSTLYVQAQGMEVVS